MNTRAFYSAAEAQKKLGLDRNRFNYLVRNGTIKRVILPGKKIGVYPIADIDKFAAIVETAINLYDPTDVHVEVAEEDELEDVYQIGISVFHGVTTPIEITREWIRRCPECIHILKTGSNEIVGHFIIIPMPEERAIEVISRKIIVGDIPKEEIQNFIPGPTINAYVRQIAILQTSNKNIESRWGTVLLAGAYTFLENLGLRGVRLGNIYALATTKDGRRTCQILGFDRLPIVPDPSKPNEIAYRLNMQESGVIFARHYRENYQSSLKNNYERVRPEEQQEQNNDKKVTKTRKGA